jgi:hypothetical protein
VRRSGTRKSAVSAKGNGPRTNKQCFVFDLPIHQLASAGWSPRGRHQQIPPSNKGILEHRSEVAVAAGLGMAWRNGALGMDCSVQPSALDPRGQLSLCLSASLPLAGICSGVIVFLGLSTLHSHSIDRGSGSSLLLAIHLVIKRGYGQLVSEEAIGHRKCKSAKSEKHCGKGPGHECQALCLPPLWPGR